MNAIQRDTGRTGDLLVIGAGPAGLAVVHELLRAGMRPRVVDRAAGVAQPWRDRHDGLRLNTHRRLSALPGMAFPRSAGAFPHRDDVVSYLEAYERDLGVEVAYGTDVFRIAPRDDRWLVQTSMGELSARDVVVATGPDRVPVRPRWPGEDSYRGEVVHASQVRELDRLAGARVLIVGGGNPGVDLAGALSHVGARQLWVSVRHGVTVVPRRLAGVPVHPMAIATRGLSVRYHDNATQMLSRAAFGDLGNLGFPRPPAGAKTLLITRGISPATDDGFVDALRRGQAEVVAEVASFTPSSVRLRDGRNLQPDIVVCATGYRTGLEPIVGHLGVLDDLGRPTKIAADVLPGLWFAGQRPPFHGNLYARGPEARRLVRALTARRRSAPTPTPVAIP